VPTLESSYYSLPEYKHCKGEVTLCQQLPGSIYSCDSQKTIRIQSELVNTYANIIGPTDVAQPSDPES
jgi:hypothetical protein